MEGGEECRLYDGARKSELGRLEMMPIEGANLDDARYRYAAALLYRKWMVCWLNLNVWPQPIVAKMHAGLETERTRIES